MLALSEVPVRQPAAARHGDELLETARGGDRRAVERLLTRVLPRVRNLARYLVRSDSDADDVAQEALAIVYRKLDSYTGEGAFQAWVDRIVVRAAFAHHRRVKARQEGTLAPTAAEPSAPAPEASSDFLARRRMAAALDTLPEEQRLALVMHHVLELSVPEIAAEVSAPEETVRSRLRLGRERLRSKISEEG
jgi:RNA polymerase sigma-70 factor (ECF subfamily)